MKVKSGNIKDLEFDNLNFNLGSVQGESLLEKSLSKLGAGRSVLADKNLRIIAGNKTAEKFGELGNQKIIIVETTGDELVVVKRTDIDLDSQEGRELALADNQVSKINFVLAEEVLAETLSVEVCEAWGVKFEETVNEIASEDNFEGNIDTIETDIVLGDLIEIGEHRLLCGDSTNFNDVEKLLNENTTTIAFTDPPHDFTEEQHQEVLNNCIAFSKGDVFILSANDKLISLSYENKDIFNDFLVHDFVFHIGGGHAPLRQFDLIAHFRKTKFYNMNDGFSNCIRVNSMRMGGYVKEKIHDHQKHIDLYAAFYNHYTVKGDSILDLFGGSGTAIVAAHQLKRTAYVIEYNPSYCQMIIDRMIKLDPSLTIKRNGIDVTSECLDKL